MRFALNDEQVEIQRTARAILQRRAAFEQVNAIAALGGTHDDALWGEMIALGWPGIAISEAFGGQGLGIVELCIIAEELGAALAPTPLLPSACAAVIIERAGSIEQRERWLPALASGEAQGAVGLSTRFGATVVAGGADADVNVVISDTEAELVPADDAETERVVTVDPLRDYSRIVGVGEPLRGEHVANGVGAALVAVSAELTGVCQRALDLTVSYAKERRQFGAPIGAFQAVSHRCVDMLISTESARSCTYSAAWAQDGADTQQHETAMIAKVVASVAALEVTASAIQVHGGVGFTWEAGIHWWYKRAQMDAQLLGGPGLHRSRLGDVLIRSVSRFADNDARAAISGVRPR